ncbi:DUF5333 domain-containing protein [Marinovum sp.]|uniref:DUF5333 domain-containing protein n=1 Tax=Marinovum sp. TaxID=2024839 RepID=UPI002B276AE7|nr:DUF5333 domain-containing protein [Marinovum sp.]
MKRFGIVMLLALAGPALALPSLATVKPINDGLRAVMIADQIRIACPTMGARMIAGWSFIRSLEAQARDMGYSAEAIEEFVESKSERKRLEGEAAAYMKARGVVGGQPETYCALGREEIEKGSQIGAFLKAK